MRKITAGLFISLDGVVEAPDQWHFTYFNEEMGAAVDATLWRRRHRPLRPQDQRQLRRGEGMRLFDDGETPAPLRLISSETFKTGASPISEAGRLRQ